MSPEDALHMLEVHLLPSANHTRILEFALGQKPGTYQLQVEL